MRALCTKKEFPLKKGFGVVALILFILINESTISWLLALVVGQYSIDEGFERAFRYFNIVGFLFSGLFRLIPYLILTLIVFKSKLTTNLAGWLAVWVAMFVVVAFHAYGYWEVQHSLYTSEHTSSTASIAFIFIPFHAIFYGSIAGAVVYFSGLVVKAVSNRA
jgi:hypothetical protein